MLFVKYFLWMKCCFGLFFFPPLWLVIQTLHNFASLGWEIYICGCPKCYSQFGFLWEILLTLQWDFVDFIWVWILKMVTMGTWSMGSNLVLRTMVLKSIEFKKNLQPYHFAWNPKSNAIAKELQGCLWQIFVKFFSTLAPLSSCVLKIFQLFGFGAKGGNEWFKEVYFSYNGV